MTEIIKISSLEENEAIISRGLNTFRDVGNALTIIRDNKQYKETHSTFEDYCVDRWGFGRSYAYDLIKSSKAVKSLSDTSDTLPDTERQAAAVAKAPPEEQADVWQQAQEETGKDQPTAKEIKDVVESRKPVIATLHTGDEESYTPNQYIESARKVMVSIDLDPASNDMAQETVQAKKYYTVDDDGLSKEWSGRVWMNPPYTARVINGFISKLVKHYNDGDISEAIVLTNNNTDTAWFHEAANSCAAICFTSGRINFMKRDGSKSSPTNGQAFIYFGKSKARFRKEFSNHGLVMEVSK